MNKQELINKLNKILEEPSELEGSDLDIIYNIAIKRAIHLAEDLNEQTTINKQEIIKKLKAIYFYSPNLGSWQDGYNTGLKYAIDIIDGLEQHPTKTKKMKEIADRYDKQQPFISSTPTHYQGSIQPIDLINAQELNFNLGNVVKYVCRAGKKQGENILSDLEKAKDYINFEIERVKKWQVFIY